MNTNLPHTDRGDQPPPIRPLQTPGSWKKRALVVCGLILVCCGITAAATAWWVKHNIYASPLMPVHLSQSEQSVLDQKLNSLGASADAAASVKTAKQRADEERRTLVLSEKEINAFLERQGLGQQMKVDLESKAATVTALIPMNKEVPLVGGTTLRLKISVGAEKSGERTFAFKVNDVSVGGIPLPNAWLGDIKGVNLLAGSVESDPALRRFLAGIGDFAIDSGSIRVLLND